MNLFLNPSEHELQSLIENAPQGKTIHDVVVDFDGEVLIDPQVEQPELDLNKFKFHLQLTEFSKRTLARGSRNLNNLLNNLLNAWNNQNDFSGSSLA